MRKEVLLLNVSTFIGLMIRSRFNSQFSRTTICDASQFSIYCTWLYTQHVSCPCFPYGSWNLKCSKMSTFKKLGGFYFSSLAADLCLPLPSNIRLTFTHNSMQESAVQHNDLTYCPAHAWKSAINFGRLFSCLQTSDCGRQTDAESSKLLL